MKKLKRSVIKEELVVLTGDFKLALVLNQMIYWSERTKDFDKFIKEEIDRVTLYSIDEKLEIPSMKLSNGWIYKKAEELSEETMIEVKPKAMREYLKKLVSKGWLEERKNPYILMDRTLQYRVNLIKVQQDLLNIGYSLEGYSIDLSFIRLRNAEKENSKRLKENSIVLKEDSTVEKENSIVEKENRKSEKEKAIPEITTKTIIETISEKQLSPLSPPIENFLISIKNDITDISFKTWIEPLEIKESGNKIIIATQNETRKDIIASKYLELIKIHLKKYFKFESVEVVV